MEKEKGFIAMLIAIVVVVVFLGAGGYIAYKYVTPQARPAQNNQNIVGGDKDEHGCIASAGYTWCEAKQKCLRSWEEKCEVTPVVDATAGWKTYTNKNLGISFDYPNDWTYQEFSCNLDGVAFCLAKNGVTGCGQTCGMDSPESPIYFYFDSWNYLKDKQKSLQLKNTKYQDAYNRMISTFDETENWKTYTGYGIFFKYPVEMGEPKVSQLSTQTTLDFKNSVSLSIGVRYNQNLGRNMTMNELIDEIKNNPDKSIRETSDFVVDGKPGKKIVYINMISGGGEETIIIPTLDKNGNMLICYEYGRAIGIEGGVGVEKILSTFKFTN